MTVCVRSWLAEYKHSIFHEKHSKVRKKDVLNFVSNLRWDRNPCILVNSKYFYYKDTFVHDLDFNKNVSPQQAPSFSVFGKTKTKVPKVLRLLMFSL